MVAQRQSSDNGITHDRHKPAGTPPPWPSRPRCLRAARQATRARRCWSCQPPRGGVRGSVGTRVFLVSRADLFQSQS